MINENYNTSTSLRGTQAELKYYEFMCDLYKRKTFNRAEMEKKYAISRTICTSLYRSKYIVLVGKPFNSKSIWKWVGSEPTLAMAHDIIENHRMAMKEYKRSMKQKGQLTIKPIKRVERTQPAPVQQEPIHDTSNSKMFIILAVGTLIGFLIATIIWK